MDIESPYWEAWEAQFTDLAEAAQKVNNATANIRDAAHYLCLYGENGLTPEAELEELSLMADQKENLKKVEVTTSYWQEIVLFIPQTESPS